MLHIDLLLYLWYNIKKCRKKAVNHMNKYIAFVLVLLAILLCGCLDEDVSDFNLTSYSEDVYVTTSQNITSSSPTSSSVKNKTNTNTNANKSSKISKTSSKEDKTISFNKTPEFANVGKSLLEISTQNPNMVLNPSKPALWNGAAQLYGEINGAFAYYFYTGNGLPFLNNLYNDGYSADVNCVGIYTTVGRVFKNTTNQTTPKEFFKALGISEYEYTSNFVLEPGMIEFEYLNYKIIISYFEELDKNLIYGNSKELDIPPQYIKNSYPVFIIDKTVNSGTGYDKWVSDNNI